MSNVGYPCTRGSRDRYSTDWTAGLRTEDPTCLCPVSRLEFFLLRFLKISTLASWNCSCTMHYSVNGIHSSLQTSDKHEQTQHAHILQLQDFKHSYLTSMAAVTYAPGTRGLPIMLS